MRCAGAVGFDAAFGAAHDGCRLGDVQLLPVTQQKRLPLTRRQLPQLNFNDFNQLGLLQAIGRAIARLGIVGARERFERVGTPRPPCPRKGRRTR